MIAAVLRTALRTQWTEKNYNNEIGLPVSVLRLKPDCEAAVLEMGMNHFGELSVLTRIAQPDLAVITNIGTMHIENLGSREGILQAKLEILEGLRMNFTGECTEVGMYLAMSRQAIRAGYPEIGAFYQQAAFEEAEHAAKFAELLGEVVTNSTKKNLELRVAAENGATAGKLDLAKKAKALNLDAIHDTVHEMAKDEARHGCGFEGLLKRYFGK